MVHIAIVVTSSNIIDLKKAKTYAEEVGLGCTNLVTSQWNRYCSFCITPDGTRPDTVECKLGKELRDIWKLCVSEDKLDLEWINVSFNGNSNVVSIGELKKC